MNLDLGFYFKIFVRRLPYFLVMLALGTAAGISLAVVLPPSYDSQATLIVESEQIPDDLAASTVRTSASEQLSIIRQRVLSRNQLLDIAEAHGVYASEPRMPADEKVSDMRRRISFSTSGGPGDRRNPTTATVVTIGFSADSGQTASEVANDLVTLILEENRQMRTTVSGQTLEFFDQEVARLEGELSEISGRILAFQEQNLNALPDSTEYRRAQQAQLQERFAQLTRDETTLTERRDRLEQLAAAGVSSSEPQEAQSPEEQQLSDLRREYSSLSAVLSDQNPRLAVLSRRIEALEGVVSEQRASRTGVEPQAGEAPPSMVDIQIADIDGQLAFIADQQSSIQERLSELSDTLAATPGNAITLGTLQRDFENIQAQYNRAVTNRAQAETGDVIESMSKGQRMSMVEAAIAPSAPTSPNRPLLAAAGVAGGLVGGIALVVLLELLSSAIRRPVDLTKRLGVTPFTTIPYIRTAEENRRRRTIVFGTIAVILIGLPVALWYVNANVVSLEPLLQRALQEVNLAAAVIDTPSIPA